MEEIWPGVSCDNGGVLAWQHLIHPISSGTSSSFNTRILIHPASQSPAGTLSVSLEVFQAGGLARTAPRMASIMCIQFLDPSLWRAALLQQQGVKWPWWRWITQQQRIYLFRSSGPSHLWSWAWEKGVKPLLKSSVRRTKADLQPPEIHEDTDTQEIIFKF